MSVRSRRPAPSLTSLRKSFIDSAVAAGLTHEEDDEEKAAVAPRRVCVSWVYLSPLARATDNRASAGYRASGERDRQRGVKRQQGGATAQRSDDDGFDHDASYSQKCREGCYQHHHYGIHGVWVCV